MNQAIDPSTPRKDLITLLLFSAVVLTAPVWLTPVGAGYPDLLQKFAIFGIFAIGYNILFGLTGYLSFGHAVFLGVGSYTAVWSFKLLSMNPIMALVLAMILAGLFAAIIGFISLRRSGIYFSILTLAFAQMSYNLAYSVLTPITNGETGLRVLKNDPRVIDDFFNVTEKANPISNLFGFDMQGYPAFYFCAIMLILAFFISMRIFHSPFGMKLQAIRSNQVRMDYTGYNTRPYLLAAFVISGIYAGLAGGLMAVTDPLAGAERMQWTASGEVILMTILGGLGTLVGPMLGATMIKYFENIFSAINESRLHEMLDFLPDGIKEFVVTVVNPFMGDGWHLTLGLLFMLVVIFLPGGFMEGIDRLKTLFSSRTKKLDATDDVPEVMENKHHG